MKSEEREAEIKHHVSKKEPKIMTALVLVSLGGPPAFLLLGFMR